MSRTEPNAANISLGGDHDGDALGSEQSGWDANRPLGFELPLLDPPSHIPDSRRERRRPPAQVPPVQSSETLHTVLQTKPASIPNSLVDDEPLTGLGPISVWFTSIYIFLRFSFLHEFITVEVRRETYMLVLVGALAYTGLLRGETWRAVKNTRLYRAWLIFCVFLLVSVPFSLWPGGSFGVTVPFVKDNFFIVPLIGGLFGSWRLVRRLLLMLGVAGAIVTFLSLTRHFDVDGRLGVYWSGSIANPNDVAAHLIFVLPFVLFAAFARSAHFLVRLLAFSSILPAFYLMLRTGSRGAAIGLAAGLVFTVVIGNARVRAVFLVGFPILAILTMVVLPKADLTRILTFSSGDSGHAEAVDSYNARRGLLINSLVATLHHPLLGVGSGQFSVYEGDKAIQEGHPHNNWQEAHNTYTQISSEDGIPAALCMIYAMVASFRIFFRLQKATKNNPQLREVWLGSFLITTWMVAFCTAQSFVNFGYRPYLLVLSGLAIAMQRATSGLALAQSESRPITLSAKQSPFIPDRAPILEPQLKSPRPKSRARATS